MGKEGKRNHFNIDVVDQGDVKIRDTGLTLIHPFCGESLRFERQWKLWQEWSDKVKEKVRIVLIDDCGVEPVHSWFTPSVLKRLDIDIAVYRITSDIKWNTSGALNLGVTVAPTEFVMFMDSDCAFPSDALEKFLEAAPNKNSIYRFPRQRVGDMNDKTEANQIRRTRFLPCSMLMHQDVFWQLGGFDEDFAGNRSPGYAFFDTDFTYRAGKEGHLGYVWHGVTALEWLPSNIGERAYGEVTKEEINRNKRFMYNKHEAGNQNRELLRFQWERTFYHRRNG